MSEPIIKIEHVSKEYRLGTIGGGTLKGDLQSLIARMRGQEDPNSLLGSAPVTGANDRFLALDDVSFDVYPGEAVGVIGRNGAGKSTLLKLLSRVTAPSKGRISFDGRIASMLEVGTGFHPELTGRENVYMNGAILGMTKAEIDRKFDQIVEFAEMEKFIDTPVKRYSSGMYVKLAFSVAAHLDSEIMIMDEVLAVGDAKFQKKCLGKMGDESTKAGRTILYVSHNMNTVRQLCTRCVVLSHGRLIFDGDVEKAISIYLDEAKNPLTLDHDFTAQPSPSHVTGLVKMMGTELLGLTSPQISLRDTLKFRLTWKTDLTDREFFIRVLFVTDTEAPCGMAMSPALSYTPGAINQTDFELDTSTLAPGEYHPQIVFCEMDSHGQQTLHDAVPSALTFEVLYDEQKLNHLSWNKGWGDIYHNPVKVLKQDVMH